MNCKEQHLVIAMKLCADAHQGQADKAGKPYILHPLRVAASGQDLNQVVLGLLHDVVEDTSYTLQDIEKRGFPEIIIEALKAITKQKSETRDQYLYRVAQNELATIVKHYDLNDNADPIRLALLKKDQAERLTQKYKEARELLVRYAAERTIYA
ncbi:MAG: HD domain-containing protein [Negativicutes bacterium]